MSRTLHGKVLTGLALLAVAGAAPLVTAEARGQGSPTKAPANDKAQGQDQLIMKDGKVLTGTIVSETPTTLKFKGLVAGIAFETEYQKSEIFEIKRAEAPKDAGAPAKPADKPAPAAAPKAPVLASSETPAADAMKVYMIELTGDFGRDISQTPIRDAVKDARKSGADVVIFSMDNDWSHQGVPKQLRKEFQMGDDTAAFDQLFRAEDIAPVFKEIAAWDKPPRVAFWVKRAMGGAAFLPLACREIYFSSEGRMGGFGNLGEVLAGMGDDVFRQKQRSLRLGHAEGIAIDGGHPAEIVRAMALKSYVLSAGFEGGTVHFYERMPENPGEILLTDDGEGENKDTAAQIAAGEGNDVLTLNAKIAKDIQISKGTADEVSDLLFKMDLPRTATIVKGRASQILKEWSEGVDKAERRINQLLDEVKEVPMGATYEEHTKARGIIKGKFQEILGLLTRYGEAFGNVENFKAFLLDQIKSIDAEQQRENQLHRKKK